MSQPRVFRVEGQGDHRLKTAALVLEAAEGKQVIDAMLGRFHVAVEHGGVRPQSEPVGGPMNGQPRLGVDLVGTDLPPHFRGEDFRAPPGRLPRPAAINSSSTAATGRRASRENQSISTAVNAFRCSRGYASCRGGRSRTCHSNGCARVQAADQVQLGASGLDGLLPTSEDLLVAHQIRLRVARDRN